MLLRRGSVFEIMGRRADHDGQRTVYARIVDPPEGYDPQSRWFRDLQKADGDRPADPAPEERERYEDRFIWKEGDLRHFDENWNPIPAKRDDEGKAPKTGR